MGSIFEINDTLQITVEQGFPAELDITKHDVAPYTAKDFEGTIFEFREKPKLRIYQSPPVRNFLVQNIDGKWLYWGLINMVEIHYDMVKKITSGKFVITYIYTPEEMRQVHRLVDRNVETDFFAAK